ncbi:hypothetical protein Ancab_013466 [Ancistrocladus abbreviatus]
MLIVAFVFRWLCHICVLKTRGFVMLEKKASLLADTELAFTCFLKICVGEYAFMEQTVAFDSNVALGIGVEIAEEVLVELAEHLMSLLEGRLRWEVTSAFLRVAFAEVDHLVLGL